MTLFEFIERHHISKTFLATRIGISKQLFDAKLKMTQRNKFSEKEEKAVRGVLKTYVESLEYDLKRLDKMSSPPSDNPDSL